jgi:hypothetical protein
VEAGMTRAVNAGLDALRELRSSDSWLLTLQQLQPSERLAIVVPGHGLGRDPSAQTCALFFGRISGAG